MAAADAPAVSPDGLTDDQAAQFLAALQEAVKSDQPKAVAALVNFPLRVNTGHQSMRVRTADAFVHDYRHIFTEPVRKAVLAQAPGQLFRNWQGAMIGNGEVWFSAVCRDAQCKQSHVGVIAVSPGL